MHRIAHFRRLAFALILLCGAGAARADDWLTNLFHGGEKIHGSGEIVSEARTVRDFNRIELDGDVSLHVRVGEKRSIKVVTDANLIDRLRTRVKHQTLTIGFKGRCEPSRACRVVVSITELDRVEMNGSGDCDIEKIEGRRFKLRVRGSGDVRLSGEIADLDIDLFGSGDINARELAAESGRIRIMGSGDLEINVGDTLDLTVFGSGDLDVYGNPETVDKSIFGSGEVRIHR